MRLKSHITTLWTCRNVTRYIKILHVTLYDSSSSNRSWNKDKQYQRATWFHFFSYRMRDSSLQESVSRDCCSNQTTGCCERRFHYTNRLRILGFHYNNWKYGDGVQPTERACRYNFANSFAWVKSPYFQQVSSFNSMNSNVPIVFNRVINCLRGNMNLYCPRINCDKF